MTNLLRRCDAATRAALQAAGRCRVVLAVLALIGFGLLATPQAIDLLITLGQNTSRPAWAGFAVATLWLAANAWFWSRFMLASIETERGRLARTVPRMLGAAGLALVSAALWNAADNVPVAMIAEMGGMESGAARLRSAAAALGGLAALALLPIDRLRRWPSAPASRPGSPATPRPASSATPRETPGARARARLDPPARIMALCSTATAMAGLIAFARDPVAASAWLSAGSIVLFAGAGLICGGTLLLYAAERTRLPVLLLVFALAGALALLRDRDTIPDNHDVRLATATLPARPGIEAAFARFLDATAAGLGGAPTPVVLVASSGGGLAAAYWTATVLGDLADASPAFTAQVFAASGVSGGALGLLAYTAARSAPGGCTASKRACLQAALHADFLGPALGAMLYPDLLQRFLPWPVFEDRAAALEAAWEASWRGVFGADTLAAPFLDLWPADRPWPALFLNGTSLGHGGRLIASNLALRPPAPSGTRGVADARSDLLAMLGADVPAATAAGISARFPYVGPLGVLRGPATNGAAADAVGDGGYFENFGATTLLDALEVLDAMARREGRPVRFVVLQLISDPDNRPDGYGDTDPLPAGGALLPVGIAGPAALLLRTRGARGLQATEALARRTLALGGSYLPVRLGRSPTGATAPLGWSLSDTAVRIIDAQWTVACRERLLADAGFGPGTASPGPEPGMDLATMWTGATCVPAEAARR